MSEEIYLELPTVTQAIAPLAPDARCRATYSAGPAFEAQHDFTSEITLIIANSELSDRSLDELTPIAEKIAQTGLAAFLETDTAPAPPIVMVTFADTAESGPFSFFNALESFVYNVSETGQLSLVQSTLSQKEQDFFRNLRRGFSDR